MELDEWLRAAWRVMVARETFPERLVFVDEMGTNTSLSPLYAWSRRGQTAHYSVPHNHGPDTTLLASMTVEGMGPCLAVEGTTTAVVFEEPTSRRISSRPFGAGSWYDGLRFCPQG
jgi:hypothetical protein